MSENNVKYLFKKRTLVFVNLDEIVGDSEDSISKNSMVFEKPDKSFSFKKLDLENMKIENPNIMQNNDTMALKNVATNLADKFNETNDPIYDLDESRTKLETAQNPISNVSNKTKTKISKSIKQSAPTTKSVKRY